MGHRLQASLQGASDEQIKDLADSYFAKHIEKTVAATWAPAIIDA